MDPEAWLGSLEPIGWRFGLERISRLLTALGMPQHRYASIHVVGTNGKSSVAAMTTALLEAHGMRTGAYLSPHEERWSERILVAGEEIGAREFAIAAERVATAIEAVERTLPEEDVVTQFEAATALAFVAFAEARIEVAVVEAGLGGRLDATNVLPSKATALTSVGLEHTEYLGETELEIAAEKLAVLRDHSVLVVGALRPDLRVLAEREANRRHARFVDASVPLDVAGLGDRAPYLSRNLAVAAAATQVIAGPLSDSTVEEAVRAMPLGGRMERNPSSGLLLDAAHNPDGARAVAEALAHAHPSTPVVACVAILAGKDAPGILAELRPAIAAIVCTELPAEILAARGRPGTEAIPADELARLAKEVGLDEIEVVTAPEAAVARARELAAGRDGVALVTGSHYLLQHGS